jgi:hypothetical protein
MVVIRSTKLSGIAQEQTSEQILAAVRSLNPVFAKAFTQLDLTVAGVLPVVHGLESLTIKVRVWDASNQEIEPDSALPSGINAAAIGMATFAPLPGTFFVQITKAG